MQRREPAVSPAQWRRGVQASKRLGRWLADWEERGRLAREGKPAPRAKKAARRS